MKGKWKLFGSLIGVSVAAVGTVSVVANYKDTQFQPNAYADARERKDNQIVFPGEDVSLGDEKTDESELWEQDEDANEDLKPEDKPDASMLFQTMKVSDETDQGQTDADENAGTDNQLTDIIYTPSTDNEKKTDQPKIHTVADAGTEDGTDTGKKSGDKKKDDPDSQKGDNPTKKPDNPTKPDHPSKPNNPTKPDTPSKPDNPAKPDNPTKPDHPTTPDDPTTPDTPNDPTTPDTPDDPSTPDDPAAPDTPDDPKPPKKDADTTVPTLPKDDNIIDVDHYPGDDDVTPPDPEEYQNYSLKIVDIMNDDDKINSFYEGEYLNDQRVLCGVMIYLYKDGKPLYRMTELNDNFRIGEYPQQITEDTISIDFYFRPDASYDWIKGTYQGKINYTGKLLLQSWESGKYLTQGIMLQKDTIVPLFSYYHQMISPDTEYTNTSEPVSRMFLGWSETEDGESVGPYYQLQNTGAKVLYPVTCKPLSQEYTANWVSCSRYIGTNFFSKKMQVLQNYTGTGVDLDIPDGIQSVDLPYDIDWDTWEFIYMEFDRMNVPKSMIMLDGHDNSYIHYSDEEQADYYTFHVRKSYEVDAENYFYASYHGILLDKKMQKVYDIPSEMEQVTLPETVKNLHIPEKNQIKEIHFSSAKPIKTSFTDLKNAKIYVPADAYLKYLSAWGRNPGGNGNELLTDSEATDTFIEDENGIYSADGKILYAVKNDVSGVCVIPEGVTTIAEGALDNCGAIDRLILPTTLVNLESGSLSGNAPAKILFLGETAPVIAADTFAEESVLQVLPQAESSYDSAWKDVLGSHLADICYRGFTYVDGRSESFSYLNEDAYGEEEAGAVLLHAPKNLTYFDENSMPDLNIREIAADAFSGCDSLYMVELPESVKVVGKDAFSGCTMLQGLVSYSTDTIDVRENALAGAANLRFAAFHAQNLNCESYYGSAVLFGVSGGNVTGDSYVNQFSKTYELVDEAGGKLLYGIALDENGDPVDACYLLGVTDRISGAMVLRANTTEIADHVFMNCTNPFTVSGLEHLTAIGNMAFYNSGLTGEIVIGADLVYLGGQAFSGCTGITKATIDGTGLNKNVYIDPLGTSVFSGCSSLAEVSFTGTGYYDIGYAAFSHCDQLTTVTFDENVGIDRIGEGAFSRTGLSSITFPSSVRGFDYGVFMGCESIGEVVLTSAEVPGLQIYGFGIPYSFSVTDAEENPKSGWLKVPAGSEQAFIDKWKYYMIGWLPDYAPDVTEEELEQGAAQVRDMLGIEETKQPDGSEADSETKQPDGPEMDSEGQQPDGSDMDSGTKQEDET